MTKVIRFIRIAVLLSVFSGILATIAIMSFGSHPAQIPCTLISIDQIRTALDLYRQDNGRYPTDTEGIPVLVTNWISRIPCDAWGNRFKYHLVKGIPEVVSAGADRKFDTRDDIGKPSSSSWQWGIGITSGIGVVSAVVIWRRRMARITEQTFH